MHTMLPELVCTTLQHANLPRHERCMVPSMPVLGAGLPQQGQPLQAARAAIQHRGGAAQPGREQRAGLHQQPALALARRPGLLSAQRRHARPGAQRQPQHVAGVGGQLRPAWKLQLLVKAGRAAAPEGCDTGLASAQAAARFWQNTVWIVWYPSWGEHRHLPAH